MTATLTAEIKRIGDFSDADIDLFFSFLKESFLPKGDYFLQEGQVCRYLAYTLSGLTMHYKMADGVEIKPGQKVEFKPGSYHLMFVNLKTPLKQGSRVKATLNFEKAGAVDVEFPVQAIGAGAPPTMQMQ